RGVARARLNCGALTGSGNGGYKQNHLAIFVAHMIKRLIPFLFLLSVAGNALAAVSPHQDGEGGCSSDCCQTARHPGQDAVASKLCCLSECQESAETTNPHAAIAGLAQQQRHAFTPRFFSFSEPVSPAPRT